MMTSEEREFRLRPRKPPVRSERATYASAYKTDALRSHEPLL